MSIRCRDRLRTDCRGLALMAGFGVGTLSATIVATAHAVSARTLPADVAVAAAGTTSLLWGTAFLGSLAIGRNVRRAHRQGASLEAADVVECLCMFATLALAGPALGCARIPCEAMSTLAADLLTADHAVGIAAALALAGVLAARCRRPLTGRLAPGSDA